MSALVLFAAVSSYATSFANGFALDDVPVIQRNELLHTLDAVRIWTSPYWPAGEALGLYRPLTSFLFALQWVVGSGAPVVFHVMSVALHAVASVLVLVLLASLLPGGVLGQRAAAAGALLFAVHPVHVEAVANVVGQSEILAAIAVLGALTIHAHRGAAPEVATRRAAALTLLYAAGLSAKEHAIVLPMLLMMVDLAQGRVRWESASVRRYVRAVAPTGLVLLGIAVLYLLTRHAVLGSIVGSNPNPGLGYLQNELRVWNAVRAWPEYYRLLLFPLDLSADYSPGVIPVVRSLEPVTAIGLLLLLLTILRAVRVGASMTGLAAAWLVITILPVSNLLFPIGVLVAERTLYLPSVAVSIVAALAYLRLAEWRPKLTRFVIPVGLGVLAALAVRTLLRNPVWNSTESFQLALIAEHPESYRAQWALGARALQAGDRERATRHYRLAERLYDGDPLFLLDYANFHLQSGDVSLGLAYLQAARALHPAQVPARVTSAFLFNRIGQYDSAYVLMAGLQQEGKVSGDVDLELARSLEGLGRYALAGKRWIQGGRGAGDGRWIYAAIAARAFARADHDSAAHAALEEARLYTPADTGALRTLSIVEGLIANGCYDQPSCEEDPLPRFPAEKPAKE